MGADTGTNTDMVKRILDDAKDPSQMENWPITTSSDITYLMKNLVDDADHVFWTSGSTGDPSPFAYTAETWDRLVDGMAQVFELGGADEDDVFLSFGAPLDKGHMSGPGFKEGAERLGAEVVNNSLADYEEGLVDRERITTVTGIPLLLHSHGEKIADEYGPLPDVFPNLELAFTGGDTLNPYLRETLEDQWGLDRVSDLYAATEFGMAAGEHFEPGSMVPLLDRNVFELVPEDVAYDDTENTVNLTDVDETDIYPVQDLEDPMTGYLLVSDMDRDLVPLSRYYSGDIFRVTPTDDVPRIEFLGRDTEIISLAGAPVHEAQIDNALRDTYGSAVQDWRAIISKPDGIYPQLDVYPVTTNMDTDEEAFVTALYQHNNAVETADREDTISSISLTPVTSISMLEQEYLDDYTIENDIITTAMKANRIGIDTSYTA